MRGSFLCDKGGNNNNKRIDAILILKLISSKVRLKAGLSMGGVEVGAW